MLERNERPLQVFREKRERGAGWRERVMEKEWEGWMERASDGERYRKGGMERTMEREKEGRVERRKGET